VTETATANRPWLPYVVPMVLFLGLTALEGQLPHLYVPLYIAKVVVVLAALVFFRSVWKEITFDAKWIVPSVVIGVALCAVWIWVEKNVQYPHFLGERTAFNPYSEIDNPGMRAAFFGFRFFGLVLLVPVMEEIFWRSFLLRFITKPDFLSLKVGEFSTNALLIGSALFGLAHPEWLPAVIFALAISLWLKHTKSLFAAIIVHLVTNLALGIYVVTQRDWYFW
jgi:CAAX prenyl protease-like protein